MEEIFIILLNGIKFKIWRVTFFKSFLSLKILGWYSGFRATDDLPRSHWDETEFTGVLKSENVIEKKKDLIVRLLLSRKYATREFI